MNICLKILSLVILWGAGQFLLSCKKEALMTTAKLPLVIKEDTAATGQLQLSVSIANDMEIALIEFQKLFFHLDNAPQRTRKHVASPARKSS